MGNLTLPNRDLQKLIGQDVSKLTDTQLLELFEAERLGTAVPGELPIELEIRRNRALDSPFYLATEELDPWYKQHFEVFHQQLLDDVLAPYMLGETVRFQGSNHDPKQYRGLLVLASRGTLKSTIAGLIVCWLAPHRKIRQKQDSRTMFVHQVFDKAVKQSESIRDIARHNEKFREIFPEFAVRAGADWDTRAEWRWPCFKTYQAKEWSFVAYGESSSKIGGHYTERIVDDWVHEDSPRGAEQLQVSHDRFVMMDHLRDRSTPFNPWVAIGTHYHYQDTYKQLERRGGWLVLRMPGHLGSPKTVFDLAALDDRTKEGRLKLEVGLKKLEQERSADLMFPKFLPWRELVQTARSTGPLQYGGQILLDPVPEGEQRFSEHAVGRMIEEELWPPDVCWGYLRCDPAISMRREADETCIGIGLVRWDGWRMLVDGWLGRERQPAKIVLRIFDMVRLWQGRGYQMKNIGIESVAYQEALAEMCRFGVPQREPKHDGEPVPIATKPCAVRSITRSSAVRKQERILELDGPISRYELKIWRGCAIGPKVQLYLKNFPFDRDDALDMLHDLYDGTLAPPRQGSSVLDLHPELRRVLRRSVRDKDKSRMHDGCQTVQLTSWS